MRPYPPSEAHHILLWADGFWCFKEELRADFLRGDNYREIVSHSDEWLEIISKSNGIHPER